MAPSRELPPIIRSAPVDAASYDRGVHDAREVIAREIERLAAENGGAAIELEPLVNDRTPAVMGAGVATVRIRLEITGATDDVLATVRRIFAEAR